MKPYFEYLDTLNNPFEAFLYDAQTSTVFSILPHWHYFVEILYKESNLNEKFAEVSEYIFGHYQEDISVEDLARKFRMSYSYFAAKFKEYYGQTCKEMILAVRLQKAEDLLRFTDFDLTYISQETGFCDCSHFIKAFKQKYGVTPRKYRNSP